MRKHPLRKKHQVGTIFECKGWGLYIVTKSSSRYITLHLIGKLTTSPEEKIDFEINKTFIDSWIEEGYFRRLSIP